MTSAASRSRGPGRRRRPGQGMGDLPLALLPPSRALGEQRRRFRVGARGTDQDPVNVTGKLRRLGKRLRALAELKAATLTHCEYCIDMGSAISRRWGLADEELLALPGYRESPLFSELDKLVLDYAVAMSRTLADVPDELFGKLRVPRWRPDRGTHAPHRPGEHARPLRPGARRRPGGLQRGHGDRYLDWLTAEVDAGRADQPGGGGCAVAGR